MYINVKREDSLKYDKLKLCYIDEINETYWDLTPEAKAYRETEKYKEQTRLMHEKLRRQGFLSSNDPEFGWDANPILSRGCESKDYPNPDYIPGKQEYYAYFTPIDIDKQWGDDWDDAPYEYNAEPPYDDYYEGDTRVEIDIVRVPFNVYHDGWHVRFPKDWGGSNSLFCIKDINAGAVAWIFDGSSTTAICAGCNPEEFFKKLDIINEKHKNDE